MIDVSGGMTEDTIEALFGRTTLRQIEIMVAVKRHNSMTKAAEELGMSVANVSRMSKRFENNLGRRIFKGDQRRSVLSDEGHKIVESLNPLMAQIDALKFSWQKILD